MSNFFNSIGIADMEKVHSAVIGWMFSDKCEAFGNSGKRVKSKLLCDLFGVPKVEFNTITVYIEAFNIDILIETIDSTGNTGCWVIENKIKSNQHSNQLDKYVDIIEGKGEKQKTSKYNSSEKHYCFLTLIKEAPKGKHSDKWCNAQYQRFSELIANALNVKTNSNFSHFDRLSLNEYYKCIKEISDSLDDFISAPSKYEFVFTEGNKKKSDKDNTYLSKIEKKYKSTGRFIAENGLETIFQKCYLGKLAKDLKFPFQIAETRGNAMLNVDVTDKVTWGKVGKTYPNVKLHAGIEFQKGTFKIQIHDMYNKAGNSAAKEKFNSQWEKAFNNADPSKTTNPSKKNGRYYVSMSISSKKDWWKGSSCMDLNKIIEKCINDLQKVVDSHPKEEALGEKKF